MYGVRKGDNVVISPKFLGGNSFFGTFTSVKDSNGFGIIGRNENWVLAPKYKIISPVVDKYFISYSESDSVFTFWKMKKVISKHWFFFDLEYEKYLDMLSKSTSRYKELILRVDQMCRMASDDFVEFQKRKHLLSVAILYNYWSTKWLVEQLNGIE